MAKSPAQKQADYRARMRATHARVIVYLPRATAAQVAAQCLQLGVSMSDLVTLALERFAADPKRK